MELFTKISAALGWCLALAVAVGLTLVVVQLTRDLLQDHRAGDITGATIWIPLTLVWVGLFSLWGVVIYFIPQVFFTTVTIVSQYDRTLSN